MAKPGFYAVHKGIKPGIYKTWVECEAMVKGFNGAKYKKFDTEAQAEEFVVHGPGAGTSIPSTAADSKGKKRALPEDESSDGYEVYCDGACSNNGKPNAVAGYGVWWADGDDRNVSRRCPGDQTNNRAELIAISTVLEEAPMDKPLHIKTDSNYSIKCVKEYLPKWKERGWKLADGGEVKNLSIIKYIDAHLARRGSKGQMVKFHHVRGHAGIYGNERADQLAVTGTSMPTVSEPNWGTLLADLNRELGTEGVEESPRSSSYEVADKEGSIQVNAILSSPSKKANEGSKPTPADVGSPTKIRRLDSPQTKDAPKALTDTHKVEVSPSQGMQLIKPSKVRVSLSPQNFKRFSLDVVPSPKELVDFADCVPHDDQTSQTTRSSKKVSGAVDSVSAEEIEALAEGWDDRIDPSELI